MLKIIFKNVFRQIKGSFGRFFAIFAIVAIGVAFFAGVTAAPGDMRHSSDCYYDEYNLNDIRLLSNIGFTDDDIEAIRQADGVKGVHASYTLDAVAGYNDKQSTIRINGLSVTALSDDDEDYINRLRIKEGRLPEKEGECVVKYTETLKDDIHVGDVLKLSSGDESDIADNIKNTEYTVVGIIYTPYYLSIDVGQSNVGTGNIGFCIDILDSEFLSDYYTEVFATVDDVKELDTYSDKYFDEVGKVTGSLEALAHVRLDERKDELKSELESQKEEAIAEAEENIRQKATQQLYDTYKRYYPGRDVTHIVEPMIESTVAKALEQFDKSGIESSFDEAAEEIDKQSEDWEWHVLDRNQQYSFMDYKSSAKRMEAIAVVFPLFFVIVAGLVCLTTMTRMVDEQRELIGTFKALGYRKSAIAMIYVLYSVITSLLGSFLGCIVGLKLFPKIIYNSWNILYDMPPITYDSHILLSIIAIGTITAVIVLSTIFACYDSLMEVPSALMRPKAPKKGKKILLERIKFIWKRMSFSNKVTARNLLRYKKRFFMTVVGVAGGCALMMAGFGIKDSITALIDKQFNDITKYDVSINYDDETVKEKVDEDDRFEESMSVYSYKADIKTTENITDKDSQLKEDIVVNVISDKENFDKYLSLRKRNSKEEYKIGDEGVYITEKAANDLGLKAGDTLYIESGEGTSAQVKIAKVVEMYSGHYVYMTKQLYNDTFGEEYSDNCLLGIIKNTDNDTEAQIGTEYMEVSGVNGITFFSSNITKFTNMIDALNLVTYILILSAAALTFVVVYNLTNVNISERIREIATIKVLGFYNGEVALYVYKENVIISMIGAAVGLVLGTFLHGYIMKTVELDNVMFGNYKSPISFVYSFILTMVFSIIVNLVMYGKLKKVPMVESLKSIE